MWVCMYWTLREGVRVRGFEKKPKGARLCEFGENGWDMFLRKNYANYFALPHILVRGATLSKWDWEVCMYATS